MPRSSSSPSPTPPTTSSEPSPATPRKGIDIAPNPGPQTQFLKLSCREALYGGAAGGGKSWALLADALRCVGKGYGRNYKALLLRRTFPDLEKTLILESQKFYRMLGGVYNATAKRWSFPEGELIYFGYIDRDRDVYQYQGTEFQYVGFDELTQFTEFQYLYLGYSRMRSTVGIPLRLRGTSNPGGDGHEWVLGRYEPWLNPKHPQHAGSGQILFFQRGDDERELVVDPSAPRSRARSFVGASVKDNPYLAGTSYETDLDSLDPVTRAHLRDGNWLAKPGKGLYFKRAWFGEPVDASPAQAARIRWWDRASSIEKTADFTAGLRLAKTPNGLYYIEDVIRFRGTPREVETTILQTASNDGRGVMVALSKDPGQAGEFEAASYARKLAGYNCRFIRETGQKIVRAQPASAQCEARNFRIVKGAWNKAFLDEAESFPEGHDDQIDSLSGGFSILSPPQTYRNFDHLPPG